MSKFSEKLAKRSIDAQAQLVQTIPGLGAIAATAFLAAVGDIQAFRNGREGAAWMGLTPRQHSTGGPATDYTTLGFDA